MYRWPILLVISLLLFFGTTSRGSTISEGLRKRLSACDTNGTVSVWIFFRHTNKENEGSENRRNAIREAEMGHLHPKAIERRRRTQSTTTTGFSASIVSEDSPVSPHHIQRILSLQSDIKLRVESKWLNAISVQMPSCSDVLISKISQFPFVESVSHVSARRRALPKFSQPQQHQNQDSSGSKRHTLSGYNYGRSTAALNAMQVPELHQKGFTGKNVTIGVLDAGFDISHPSISHLKIQAMYDFVRNDSNPQYEQGDDPIITFHGTAVLSTIAGALEGELFGPAFNATFLLARTEDYIFEFIDEEDYFVAGLEWAEAQGADIVTASLSYHDWVSWEQLDGNQTITARGIKHAVARGVLVVVAGGNTGDRLGTPADAVDVLTVGAVASNNLIVDFSSRGPTFDGRIKPEVVAPGVNVYAAGQNRGFVYVNGTSFSAPYVAGIAALMMQMHPNWTSQQVRAAMMATATRKNSPDVNYGWGFVQASDAANYTFSTCQQSCRNGLCVQDKCVCNSGYYGYNCENALVRCSEWCGIGVMNYGVCSANSCICKVTSSFPRCSIPAASTGMPKSGSSTQPGPGSIPLPSSSTVTSLSTSWTFLICLILLLSRNIS